MKHFLFDIFVASPSSGHMNENVKYSMYNSASTEFHAVGGQSTMNQYANLLKPPTATDFGQDGKKCPNVSQNL